MLDPATAVRHLEAAGFTHVVWIPDSALGPWEPALVSSDKLKLVRPCREGEAVGQAPTDEVPSLFPATEARGFLDRWGEVQSRFVDDPKRAVHDGDALVAEVMQTLAASFARHKADLEGQWNTGDAATDDLRQAFQRYRAFFQRLLSA